MRLLVAVILLFAPALRAACPESLSIFETTAHTVTVKWSTDTVGAATKSRIQFFAPTLHADWEYRDGEFVTTAAAATRASTIRALQAATAYFFDPQVTNAAGTAWSDYTQCQAQLCPSGAGVQPGGYSCGEVDAAPACGGSACYAPTVTTLAESGSHPAAPDPPVHADPDPFTPPAVTGSTFNVAGDGSDLQTQMEACEAAAEADGGVHEVVIPAGVEARPELEALRQYTLPNLSQGTCILRSGAAAQFVPPPGHALHAGYKRTGQLSRVVTNRDSSDYNNTGGARGLIKEETGGAKGWRIGPGIVFGMPDPSVTNEEEHTITAFDASDGKITSPGHGLGLYDLIQIELTGVEHVVAHRACYVYLPITTDTFYCLGMNSGAVGGTFTAGKWTPDVARRLTSCTSGGLCTLEGTHPFGNFHSYGVVSFSGTALQLDDATLQLTNGASIKVSGSGSCDGIYGIASQSGDTVTTKTAAPATCNSGTARQVGMALLGDLSDAGANGAYIVEWPDSATMQVLQPSLPGAVTGGWLSYDPPLPNTAMMLLSASSDIVFDRVGFEGPEPWRPRGAIAATGSTNVAIVGSYSSGFTPWVAVDPNTGVGSGQSGQSLNLLLGAFLSSQKGDDIQMLRTRLADTAVAMFSDGSATGYPQNVSIKGVEHWISPRLIPGRAEAQRTGHLLNNSFEWKHMDKLLVKGLIDHGNAAVRQPSGAALLLSYGPGFDGERLEDVTVQDVDLWAASCIEIVDQGAFPSANEVAALPVRRLKFSNVICDADRTTNPGEQMIGQPGSDLLFVAGGYAGNGAGFFMKAAGSDVLVEKATARVRGSFPLLFWTVGLRQHAFQVNSSIFAASIQSGAFADIDGSFGNWGTILPAVGDINSWPLWKTFMTEGPGTLDPTSDFDAKIIPVSATPTDPTWLTASNSVKGTLQTRLDCSGEPGGCPSNFTLEFSGSDPDTGANRLSAVFEPGQWLRKTGVFAGYGHDQDQLDDSLYRIRSLAATGISGGLRLTYTAPAGQVCAYQRTSLTETYNGVSIPDWAGASAWGFDAGGSASRSVDVTGLSSGTVYWFRLTCGLHEALVRGRAL